ncbi:MAG: hypothetical protein ABEJ28_09470 [Salinigranum sp.]
MRPSIPRFALVVLLATAVVAAGAAPAASREPPQAACGVCTDALTTAAADHGVPLSTGRATLSVRVGADASTRWTARVALREGASALRNDSLRADVVAEALGRARAVGDPRNVTSRLEGSTLVVSARDPGLARRTAGVVLFTGFHASDPAMPLTGGGEGTVYQGADQVVVRGPDGYVASGDYAGASENRTAVRWERDPNAVVDRSTVLAFVPGRAALPGVRAFLARTLFRLGA